MNTSCNNCRTRHYKCDGKVPQCGRCERTGRPCIRETRWKFKHRQFPQTDLQKQKWLPVPPKVDFIAENGIDGPDSDEEFNGEEDAANTAGIVTNNVISLDADIILDPLLTHPTPSFPSANHDDPESLSPFISLTASASWLADVERLHSIAISTPQSAVSTPGRLQKLNQWPLPVEEEAMLLRYFIDNVSRFFDVSEPIQYFRVDIPQRARTNATLANAIMALSSRILQWKEGYNPHVADRYYQKCLEALIPALSDEALVMDDTLLAATIFLRMLEEMDSHISGLDDGGRHLSGTQAIISVATDAHHQNPSSTSANPPTGFRLAAYWTAFRQELWLALHKRQPVTLSVRRVCGFVDDYSDDYSSNGFDHHLRNHIHQHHPSPRSGVGSVGVFSAPAPDWIWTQRAVAHCGDTLDCIFGDFERAEGMRRWRTLVADNERWWRNVPRSFGPFFGGFEGEVGEVGVGTPTGERGVGGGAGGAGGFPELRCHLEWHVMGFAYIVLARLLLIVHDPTVPTLGPQRRRAIAEIDKKARRDVRILCGIGLSNDAVPPAILISCMAVTLFADRFTNQTEQERLYWVLLETERRHGWPTAQARAQLKEMWGC
ncbi:Arca-like protein [Lasiodiplodia theobromae]|uniref:Arca-like protein n=1 Tax=Lasiodiplodia theobromae TaxID=45133 RepID=UPI0015C365B9|nr:Arca-like protein [Lasiodiplodia theobromae]KAF4546318.1 Arca-like protein [Lasiodiplodia theobromae]